MISLTQKRGPDAYRRFVEEALEQSTNQFETVYGGMMLGSK
jgi:hypothetical protein